MKNASRDAVKYRQKHSECRKAGCRRLGGEALYQSGVHLYHDCWTSSSDLIQFTERKGSTNRAGRLSQKDPVVY
jgi:hypothetical protein